LAVQMTALVIINAAGSLGDEQALNKVPIRVE
jgi:hypothetical protein